MTETPIVDFVWCGTPPAGVYGFETVGVEADRYVWAVYQVDQNLWEHVLVRIDNTDGTYTEYRPSGLYEDSDDIAVSPGGTVCADGLIQKPGASFVPVAGHGLGDY